MFLMFTTPTGDPVIVGRNYVDLVSRSKPGGSVISLAVPVGGSDVYVKESVEEVWAALRRPVVPESSPSRLE